MKLNSSDDRAIARNQAQETFYNYPYPRIDPFLEADLLHGWMFKELIKWDRVIYGRWDYWINCASNSIRRRQFPDYCDKFVQDIPRIDFLEPKYNYPGSQMLKYCLINIPHPRSRDRGTNITHLLREILSDPSGILPDADDSDILDELFDPTNLSQTDESDESDELGDLFS